MFTIIYHYFRNAYYTVEETDVTGNDLNLDFDFCEPLPYERHCHGNETLATISDKDGDFNQTCSTLTEAAGKGETVTLVETDNEKDEHLILAYSNGTECPLEDEASYGITFEVFCDNEAEDVKYSLNTERTNACRKFVDVHHKSGCKKGDLNGLWRFVESNAWIFAIVFMVVGAFSLVLGLKLIRPTLFIFGTFSTVALILFLFYVLILPNNVKEWVGWVILSVSVLLGLIVGFFASKLIRVGVFVLGVWGGIGIALILNNTVFYKINSVAVLWVMIAVFGLVLGILSFVWFDYIVIICTSILGGYLFIRGISLFAGGYPNEFTVYERIRDGDMSAVPGTFYAYLAGIVILIAMGLYAQIRIKRRGAKKSSSQYDYYKRV